MIKKAINFVLVNSLLLIAGAATALLWANLGNHSYEKFIHLQLLPATALSAISHGQPIDLQFLVNNVLMALFFVIAGYEVWEAFLPEGALHDPRSAATPLICTVGGMAGPAAIYLVGAHLFGQFDQLYRGWAVPCATDIAFSYLIAKLIFGLHHPAISFLLLLAIADDALGLVVLAVFYPQAPVHPVWLLLCAAAVATGLLFWLLKLKHFLWYLLIPGAISWLGFAMAGLHPALGLLPIVPLVPHIHIHKRHFGWEVPQPGNMHQLEYWLSHPAEVILGLFGLFNAGVVLASTSHVTVLVVTGLIIGKPLGILLGALLSVGLLGFKLHKDIGAGELLVIGLAAGIGFTVALFVATVAFAEGPLQDSAKMGAMASFGAALLALITAKLLGLKRTT